VAMSKPVYTIHAERDGAWWALDVPELRGVHSQSKRLDQARAVIEEVIDLMYDRSRDTYELELVIDDEEIVIAARVAKGSREVVESVSQLARLLQAVAIQQLRERGLPLRDIGELVGVSHQRIAQLERAPNADREAAAADARTAMVDQLEQLLKVSIALDTRRTPVRSTGGAG
jgi:predicted RNase H-like HicB family nuclease